MFAGEVDPHRNVTPGKACHGLHDGDFDGRICVHFQRTRKFQPDVCDRHRAPEIGHARGISPFGGGAYHFNHEHQDDEGYDDDGADPERGVSGPERIVDLP